MGRKSHARSQAKSAAAEMDDEFEAASRLWGRIRLRLPKPVRTEVDIAAELGGLSLHDVELLTYTMFVELGRRAKRLEKRPKSTTAVASCESMRLQCLKHLRTLRLAQAPITTPNDQRHPEPEEMELRRQAKERLAKEMVAQKPSRPDTGIELN